ncbi:hypothetical protein [Nocardia sp. AG03]|uniref:hypothetical protein n=1 Tax=Nocardia sp. AG03 TaxID=3025312 RepID=UPI00241827EC|nr:hypothetical protein [Nocardia sp. AG03]
MLCTLGEAMAFMADKTGDLADLAETLVAEGFGLTPTGLIASPTTHAMRNPRQ